MSRALSRITDEGARWAIETERASVRDAGARASLRAHFHLAAFLYQQGEFDEEVRTHLAAAAAVAPSAFARRPRETKARRTPWDFGLALGTVAAFGDTEGRRRMGEVERWKWFLPEEDFYRLHADALAQFQQYMAGAFVGTEARSVIERCLAENAPRASVRFNGPMVAAIEAIAQHNPVNLSAALGTMLDEHRSRALHGSLQRLPDGLIAIIPLGLARLGRLAGLEIDVSSPYLPLHLI